MEGNEELQNVKEKLEQYPILSEFDLHLSAEQLEVFQNIARLLASKAVDLAEREVIITNRKRRKETKRRSQESTS